MKLIIIRSLIVSIFVATVFCVPVKQLRRQNSQTSIINLGVKRGSPRHLAAGIIYGEPDTPNQIPDKFYTEAGLNYFRAGGAQLDEPNRGWIWGEYQGRFRSTLSNYNTARAYEGTFIILPHDIWGTDHANSSTIWPGDDGNWSDYDSFLNQLLSDLKSHDMLEGMVFDIWNEPDQYTFWARSQQQWLDLYVRTHRTIRSDPSLDSLLISGPTLSGQPSSDNSWWTNYLSTIASNDIIPDQYAWHLEGDINNPIDDLETNNSTLTNMLTSYALPQRQVNINEYGVPTEQVPSAAVWWISRLERYEAFGLRGNWRSAFELHDYLAQLLGKPGAGTSKYSSTAGGYYPVGEWQVYRYYSTNMTGSLVKTTGSPDRIFDTYATTDSNTIRILAGTRISTGTWYISLQNLSSVGLSTSGSINIRTWKFPVNGDGLYGEVDAPTDLGVVSHSYSSNGVSFPFYADDTTTAYAFEINI